MLLEALSVVNRHFATSIPNPSRISVVKALMFTPVCLSPKIFVASTPENSTKLSSRYCAVTVAYYAPVSFCFHRSVVTPIVVFTFPK